MAKQMSLFGDESLNRADFAADLQNFSLNKAIENLHKWNHTFNPPPDLDKKIDALNWLIRQLETHQDQAIPYLAWLFHDLHKVTELQPLKNEFPLLKMGINKALYQRLDKHSIDFISEDVHPAEIFIRQNDYPAALSSLKKYFERYGEQPFLRQLQGYVLWQQDKRRDALVLYTFVVFADPFVLRDDYLLPKMFRKKLKYLHLKYNDERKALSRLAFELWHDGQTYIEGNQPSFENFIRTKLDKLARQKNDLTAKALHFNALLFLAESARLSAYPNAPGPAFENLQEQMRELNYEQYAIYIDTLKAFRNI